MNQIFKRSAPFLALLGLVLAGCQPDLSDDPKSSAGRADFSRYIAIGNSLTAGYADNGLYREGQINSYPNIMSEQFRKVGGGAFVQPLFADAQANGSTYLSLTGFTVPTANSLSSPITATVATNLAVRAVTPQVLFTKFTDPVNNLGIPGIRMSDILTPGYGSMLGNPFFERITPDASPLQTYLQRVQATVAALNPTFFTEWLGSNDVLGFATAGAGANAITPLTTFTDNTNRVLDALTQGGAKGLVATIPDVTGIPFFTTVGPSFRATLALPANNVPSAAPFVYTTGLLAPGQANTRVSGTLANIRDASGTGNLLLTLTASPYLSLYGRPTGKYWRDYYQQARPSLPPSVPNLTVFLLAMGVDTTRAFGQTTQNPFPSILVLDGPEQTVIGTATTGFNTALVAAANARGLAVFDANAFFRDIATRGIAINGTTNTAAFISGNIFSLDGVHPAPRGYAIIANEMIKAINATYGSSVAGVDATKYRGVKFP